MGRSIKKGPFIDGHLLEKETRLIVKAMVGLMNITCKYAGIV